MKIHPVGVVLLHAGRRQTWWG